MIDVEVRPETLVLTDLGLADRALNLSETAAKARDTGLVSAAEAEAWLGDLRRSADDGRFFCSYTGFLVSGEKPPR